MIGALLTVLLQAIALKKHEICEIRAKLLDKRPTLVYIIPMIKTKHTHKTQGAKKMGKKFVDLDTALTIGTGMNKEERAARRNTEDDLFKIRDKAKKGSKAWRDASNKIAAMYGWPQKY